MHEDTYDLEAVRPVYFVNATTAIGTAAIINNSKMYFILYTVFYYRFKIREFIQLIRDYRACVSARSSGVRTGLGSHPRRVPMCPPPRSTDQVA